MYRHIFVFFLLFALKISTCRKVYHVSLNAENTITLDWTVDYAQNQTTFELHFPLGLAWFALGFSNRGAPFPADYCVLWTDLHRRRRLADAWADAGGLLRADRAQNCQRFGFVASARAAKLTFRRKFDTCDPHDYLLEAGTTHVVWAGGARRLYRLRGLNVSAAAESGMARVQLLRDEDVDGRLGGQVRKVDLAVDGVRVPGAETTYWCHVHKLGAEFGRKHHVYRYESHITPESAGLVHHMEVFHCDAHPDEEIPLYRGDCFAADRPKATQVCKKVLAAWAMGATPFTYPKDAGLKIGGDDFNKYIMLEVHYNNPTKRADHVDSSGIRFYVSDKLKKFDAGVLELGLEYTDKMAIPPGQAMFPLVGYCTSECTAASLPPDGIRVFGSQLHTHLTGVAVYIRHVRDGVELPELNRDNHFSTHFQEIRRLKKPVTVLPGDALVTRCDYNTLDRENVTLGGFQISDEMCVSYLHYYPKTDLEVCKSSISNLALSTYFNYMKNWENERIEPNSGISDKYKSIKWNKMRVSLLQDVYREAPLSMQCNMSNGNRFPGNWEHIPNTKIRLPLLPLPRNC